MVRLFQGKCSLSRRSDSETPARSLPDEYRGITEDGVVSDGKRDSIGGLSGSELHSMCPNVPVITVKGGRELATARGPGLWQLNAC